VSLPRRAATAKPCLTNRRASEEGDTVPADARLIESTVLHTTEAPLTGESLPVSKDIAPIPGEACLGDRHNMMFSGTAATYGRARAVVTATGMQTEMGRIAGMLKGAKDEDTPLQKELDRIGKLLGLVVIIIAVVMISTILLWSGSVVEWLAFSSSEKAWNGSSCRAPTQA